MWTGWGIFNRSLCGTLMDSPVHIIVSAHTWPAPSTDVKDPSKLCVREPHVPSQRPLMEPVKTASRARAASLILSPNYCWGRITPRIAMGGASTGRHTEGDNEPLFLLCEWKLKPALAALFVNFWIHLCKHLWTLSFHQKSLLCVLPAARIPISGLEISL